MSHSNYTPTFYVIGWRGEDVLKVGCSFRPAHHRVFRTTGGEELVVRRLRTFAEAIALERTVRRLIASRYPGAFADRDASRRLVPAGNGWMECYSVPTGEWGQVIAQVSPNDRSSDDHANR